MGQHIVKQPNGKYAIFSSVVDGFVTYDASPEELILFFRDDAIERSDRLTIRGISDADHCESRFADDIETVRLIHGDTKADEYLALLSQPELECKASGTHAAAGKDKESS